ncbi:MAG: CPBP family intramembrane metalloprotease, partial [Muribaculaceae bacterium]|nr:CPBP family intramembrane metalloprotease [Muribaculaceae bacterium]
FYGFVPRILMGAYFGYLIWWTGSLWVPVIAHAFNNSLVVVIQWISARNGIDYSEGEALANYSGADYLIIAASVALTVYCMKLLYDATHAKA